MSHPGMQFNSKGVVDGVYFCNIAQDDVLNQRLMQRNVPSVPLQPQFSMRGVSTKYSLMPIVDPRPAAQLVPPPSYPTYNPETMFNPGDTMSPWSGFAANVDVYSKLRNQGQALQRAGQSVYVPSSSSDMYESVIPVTQNVQTHGLLFKQDKLATAPTRLSGLSTKHFANHTRQDLKAASGMCPVPKSDDARA